MLNLDIVKGVIFDYGGTIDSNGKHWAEVIWDAYVDKDVPVTKTQFREAYVYVERFLATNYVIKPEDNFGQLMHAKINLQIDYLHKNSYITEIATYANDVAEQCYAFAKNMVQGEIEVLKAFRAKYPMVLVSNFYGNVQAVLKDFDILDLFDEIVESAVVGIRKPDPQIFTLGVEKLGMKGENVVVIGDSYTKDIVPASKNGCQTVWLKGIGWDDKDNVENGVLATTVISDFMELKTIFHL